MTEHQTKSRQYKARNKEVFYRAECTCNWNGPLRSGKMAKANTGRDISVHLKEVNGAEAE